MITGCSSGIGQCLTRGLKHRGYRVFATVRRADDVENLSKRGIDSLHLDFDSSASIEHAVEEVMSRTKGRLYGLINNDAFGRVQRHR